MPGYVWSSNKDKFDTNTTGYTSASMYSQISKLKPLKQYFQLSLSFWEQTQLYIQQQLYDLYINLYKVQLPLCS